MDYMEADSSVTGTVNRMGPVTEKLEQMNQETDITASIVREMETGIQNYLCTDYDIKTEQDRWMRWCVGYPNSLTTAETQQQEVAYTNRIQALEYRLGQIKQGLQERTNLLEEKFAANINKLSVLQTVLNLELAPLKLLILNHDSENNDRNENTLPEKLDTLQLWCEGLAESILTNRQQLKDLERLKQTEPSFTAGSAAENRTIVSSLITRATELLSTLISSAFVIVTQPYQVLKTKSRLPWYPCVRLLVCHPLGLNIVPPIVSVSIVNEEQVDALNDLRRRDEVSHKTVGAIMNNSGKMHYSKETGRLYYTFGNMRINSVIHKGKTKDEFVTEEKFALRFQSRVVFRQEEFICDTLSCPVVVIVSVSQEAKAWATILWDNSFKEPIRSGFKVPEMVKWCDLSKALSNKFKSINGRELNEENLQFLGEKIFGSPNFVPDSFVCWFKFCKETLGALNFTFWDWFYATIKLTREHLFDSWNQGHVIGFVRKPVYEAMLSNSMCGTFLLRFSDSVKGGVTISWCHAENTVKSLEPFTSTELATKSIVEHILDFSGITCLYPGTHKEDAFKKPETKEVTSTTNATTNGHYERRKMIWIMPDLPPTSAVGFSQSQPPSPFQVAMSPFSSQANNGFDFNSSSSSSFNSFSPGSSVSDTVGSSTSWQYAYGGQQVWEPYQDPHQLLDDINDFIESDLSTIDQLSSSTQASRFPTTLNSEGMDVQKTVRTTTDTNITHNLTANVNVDVFVNPCNWPYGSL